MPSIVPLKVISCGRPFVTSTSRQSHDVLPNSGRRRVKFWNVGDPPSFRRTKVPALEKIVTTEFAHRNNVDLIVRSFSWRALRPLFDVSRDEKINREFSAAECTCTFA